jgi:hypothetical protein
VGQERGVHYYAMQFIEGRTLAQLLEQQRQGGEAPRQERPTTDNIPAGPTTPSADTAAQGCGATLPARRDAAYCRRVAEWGVQAAEALEHAHQLGIVHRDVKPGNLMLDGQGKLWVTDFGLARVGADNGLTLTGDLLGTLRYMSPEQALAKRAVIDHRTDLYSLGATLYELLTLQPVFAGADRQELLRQIALEEPKPPRRITTTIPAELETIVLKAMEKNPADRYATAKELADDLRRYLEDRPIRAKRPTMAQRLRKWRQRHRHLVQVFVTFLALLAVGLAVSVLLIWREKEHTRQALAEAQANYARAEAQRRRAETNFREACWSIDSLLSAFDPRRKVGSVTVRDLRQYQTDKALRFLAAFCKQTSDDPAIRLQQGIAYVLQGGCIRFSLRGTKPNRRFAKRRLSSAVSSEIAPTNPVIAVNLAGPSTSWPRTFTGQDGSRMRMFATFSQSTSGARQSGSTRRMLTAFARRRCSFAVGLMPAFATRNAPYDLHTRLSRWPRSSPRRGSHWGLLLTDAVSGAPRNLRWKKPLQDQVAIIPELRLAASWPWRAGAAGSKQRQGPATRRQHS